MTVPRRYILHQLPIIRSLIRTAIASSKRPSAAPELPGPPARADLPPRSSALVRDYIRAVGGDPGAYRGVLPAHLFPQWGFPLLMETLRAIPYDLKRVLNGGCRIEIRRPLPDNEPLQLEARLVDIDDNGSRAVIKNRLRTSTSSAPDAVDAYMYAVVPLKRGDKKDKKDKDRPRVPDDAREIARWSLTPQDAVDFAFLTGDFNPVHWSKPYARASGFPSTILHGFATLARAVEGINRARFAGDPSRLSVIDVKFVRPLILPAEAGLYVRGNEVFVGTAPSGPCYLTGTFEEIARG